MFKKFLNKVEVAAKEQSIPKPITSKEIQEEMHKELRFVLENNQIEVITNEVTAFKEKNRHISTKAARLEALGFVNTPTTTVNKQLKEATREKEIQVRLETEEINLTNEYLLKFPGYKFVPERIFNSVRDKYDLYTSETGRYIKEIPEKNLEEVENFMKGIKDTYEAGLIWNRQWGDDKFSRSMTGTLEECQDYVMRRQKLQTEGEVRRGSTDYYNEVRLRTDLLQITAPVDHFDLNDSEVKGREITTKRPVEDPIVSHKVRGGYIIVSAWDKEAEIPEIQNPMNN